MPTMAGKNIFLSFFSPHKPRLFHLLTEKNGHMPSKMDFKVLIPTPTQKILTKTEDQKSFHNNKILLKFIRISEISDTIHDYML